MFGITIPSANYLNILEQSKEIWVEVLGFFITDFLRITREMPKQLLKILNPMVGPHLLQWKLMEAREKQ